MMKNPSNQLILFKTDDEKISMDVRFDNNMATKNQIAYNLWVI